MAVINTAATAFGQCFPIREGRFFGVAFAPLIRSSRISVIPSKISCVFIFILHASHTNPSDSRKVRSSFRSRSSRWERALAPSPRSAASAFTPSPYQYRRMKSCRFVCSRPSSQALMDRASCSRSQVSSTVMEGRSS